MFLGSRKVRRLIARQRVSVAGDKVFGGLQGLHRNEAARSIAFWRKRVGLQSANRKRGHRRDRPEKNIVTNSTGLAAAMVLHLLLLSSVTPLGDTQAATAVCAKENLCPFSATLARALLDAKSARRFRFPHSNSFGPIRTLEKTEKVEVNEIVGSNLDQLRTLILSVVKPDTGPGKSCPFKPSTGFQFLSGGVEAWWLVSSFCETGMLVSVQDDWRRSPVVNLTPGAIRDFEKL